MNKWADFLISEVSYDSEHLISIAIRHQDTEKGITTGLPVDRLTISSDIKNGLIYATIYHGNNSWKKGKEIETFSIDGSPYLRIDENKVNMDYLGDLPTSSIEIELPQELELLPEPAEVTPSSSKGSLPKESAEELPQELELLPEPAEVTPSSSKGSLPKESAEELPQELELLPEPAVESEDVTPEQLSKVDDLEQQIDDLENMLSSQTIPEPETEEDVTPEQLSKVDDLEQQIDDLENVLISQLDPSSEGTPDQLSRIKELEKEIEKLENVDLEHEIIETLEQQNKKLDKIEKKLQNPTTKKPTTKKPTTSNSIEAYCVKCKTKRKIKNPEATKMKNGRDATKGFCSICNCKVFRIGKMKK